MRVLFHCRPSFELFPGGDAIQIRKTKTALEALGVEVYITTSPSPNPSGYDLIHIFNPLLVSMSGARRARQLGIPVYISTIYWPMEQYFRAYLPLAKLYLKEKPPGWSAYSGEAWLRYIGYTYLWNRYMQRRLSQFISLADVLLPNSQAEAERLLEQFRPQAIITAIKNGVELGQANRSAHVPHTLSKLNQYILCVGRLELRKNQHLLIEALKNSSLPLVFVGNMTASRGYLALCEQLGRERGQTYFISHIAHELMPEVFRRARLHVMPSWYETPGLASLEAAALGVPIITTDKGGTREYFKNEATYCQPGSLSSLKNALHEMLSKKIDPNRLGERLRSQFTWQNTAAETLAAYRASTH